jgi:hypothetical protein
MFPHVEISWTKDEFGFHFLLLVVVVLQCECECVATWNLELQSVEKMNAGMRARDKHHFLAKHKDFSLLWTRQQKKLRSPEVTNTLYEFSGT